MLRINLTFFKASEWLPLGNFTEEGRMSVTSLKEWQVSCHMVWCTCINDYIRKSFFFIGQFLWKMLEREFWSRWIIWATWSLLIGRAEDIEFLDINHVEFDRPRLLEFEHRSPHPHRAELRILLILYFAFFHSTIQDTRVARNTRDIMTLPRAVGTRPVWVTSPYMSYL